MTAAQRNLLEGFSVGYATALTSRNPLSTIAPLRLQGARGKKASHNADQVLPVAKNDR
jgi:hypothetical protein